MPAPNDEYAFDLDVALAAADRWAKREKHHKKFEEAVRNNRYSELDTAERIAARANRLLGKLQRAAPAAAEVLASEMDALIGVGIRTAEVSPEAVTDELLERVIGKTRDFQFVEFLEKAIFASKSVGRIVTPLTGRRISYGTGFMVSPHLLMTNHHVLSTPDAAARSSVEFDYQRDRFGKELSVQTFRLDPTRFFINDKRLDFALVAVSPESAGRPLADYPWCPLLKEPGKIVAPEPINIIQHPKGDWKQVVIRENRLLDALDDAELFYHYEADTEPGSSGSPVFNDQWEVVAVHHSGVPKRNPKKEPLDIDGKVWKKGDDPSRLDWVANEGVRVSKLVEFIADAPVTGEASRLLKEFLDAQPPEVDTERPRQQPPRSESQRESEEDKKVSAPNQRAASVTLTVPLHITFSLGIPGAVSVSTVVTADAAPDELTLEKVEIDPDYTNRPGYDADFLGFDAPFPRLTNAIRSKAFARSGESGDERHLLKYYHYSVIFNRERNLAFVAGVNLDATAKFHHKRDKKDEWFYDPRVTPEELQAGEDLYADNPLDRGHLVRRADAGWGATRDEAKLANDDTFHFTNCSPHHAITNQGKQKIKDRGRTIVAPPGLKLWGKLENHIAKQGKSQNRKLSVFNGPVFRSTDEDYRGVQIPQEYWKVVVFANDAGDPASAAFVLTQAELIEDLREEFEVGEYKAVQVRIKDLESRTKLNFGPFSGWDVLEQEGAEESFTGDIPAVVLNSAADMVL